MASPIDRVEDAGEAVVKGTTTCRHAVAILAAAAMRHEQPFGLTSLRGDDLLSECLYACASFCI